MKLVKAPKGVRAGDVVNLNAIAFRPSYIQAEADEWTKLAARNRSSGGENNMADSFAAVLGKAARTANDMAGSLVLGAFSGDGRDVMVNNTRLICATTALARMLRYTNLVEPTVPVVRADDGADTEDIGPIIDPSEVNKGVDGAYGVILPVPVFEADYLDEGVTLNSKGDTWYRDVAAGLYVRARRPATISARTRDELTMSVGSAKAADEALAADVSVRVMPYLSLADMALSGEVMQA